MTLSISDGRPDLSVFIRVHLWSKTPATHFPVHFRLQKAILDGSSVVTTQPIAGQQRDKRSCVSNSGTAEDDVKVLRVARVSFGEARPEKLTPSLMHHASEQQQNAVHF